MAGSSTETTNVGVKYEEPVRYPGDESIWRAVRTQIKKLSVTKSDLRNIRRLWEKLNKTFSWIYGAIQSKMKNDSEMEPWKQSHL